MVKTKDEAGEQYERVTEHERERERERERESKEVEAVRKWAHSVRIRAVTLQE